MDGAKRGKAVLGSNSEPVKVKLFLMRQSMLRWKERYSVLLKNKEKEKAIRDQMSVHRDRISPGSGNNVTSHTKTLLGSAENTPCWPTCCLTENTRRGWEKNQWNLSTLNNGNVQEMRKASTEDFHQHEFHVGLWINNKKECPQKRLGKWFENQA